MCIPAYGLGETRRANVKGKADNRREVHDAVLSVICQALFSHVNHADAAHYPNESSVGLDSSLFRCKTASQSSSNALS